jgi:type I restriction enzyme R subunit
MSLDPDNLPSMGDAGPDESDTCRDFVVPAILESGWASDAIREQYQVQAEVRGRYLPDKQNRKRRADYVLFLRDDLPMAVIEAKRLWASPRDGIQQATRYASKLDVPFALSTNGTGWALYNTVTGLQSAVPGVPTPEEAWSLFVESRGLDDAAREYLLTDFNNTIRNADGSVRTLRYYQRVAIHKILAAITSGERRVLAVMATGSGKTFTALQLVWKLTSYRRFQQKTDRGLRNYRVLYLADRDFLVGGPMGDFREVYPQGAVVRVKSKNSQLSPDVYFSTYQALDARGDAGSDGEEQKLLLANYPADFFDLVIVDECHRGSARENSAWRSILDYFTDAVQLGLTATPVDRSDAKTYEYFRNPVYTYSLKDGIEDGYLAPYTVRRVMFNVDADGVEVAEGQLDAYGRQMKPGTYTTKDFERRLSLPDRTHAMARRILDVIGDTHDRAVVFCVDGAHALGMCQELRNLRPNKTAQDPEWVSRIMAVERDKTRLLEAFTDPTKDVPQIAVTSSLLSTGVDIEDLKYVILCRNVGSVSEFKQIIGRGSRLYPEKDKTEFEIVDFVGATRLFTDPTFDGPPLVVPTVETVDESGEVVAEAESDDPADVESHDASTGELIEFEEPEPMFEPGGSGELPDQSAPQPVEKFELRGVSVTLDHEGFYVHDTATGRPKLVRYVDWTRQLILENFDDPAALLAQWANIDGRTGVTDILRRGHVDPARLFAELSADDPDGIDTVDALLNVAFDRPMLTRAERARRAAAAHRQDLDALPKKARHILGLLLERYAESGVDESAPPEVINVPPLSTVGNPAEIAEAFGGAQQWHAARDELHHWLYSA